MMPFTLRLSIAFCLCLAGARAQTCAVMRIPSDDVAVTVSVLAAMGCDVDEATIGADHIEIIVTPEERAMLAATGFAPVLIAEGAPLAQFSANDGSTPSGYPNLAAVYAAMNTAAAAYPGLCQVVDLTATLGTPATFEGRHLFALKISDFVSLDEDEP